MYDNTNRGNWKRFRISKLVDRYCDGLFTDEDRTRYGPIEHWNIHRVQPTAEPLDVSNVTMMIGVFRDAPMFNQSLNKCVEQMR